jgi:hypothetical protein
MRFAGPQIGIDPTQMEYLSDRYAGQVVKENPGLADQIAAGIMMLQNESDQPAGVDSAN